MTILLEASLLLVDSLPAILFDSASSHRPIGCSAAAALGSLQHPEFSLADRRRRSRTADGTGVGSTFIGLLVDAGVQYRKMYSSTYSLPPLCTSRGLMIEAGGGSSARLESTVSRSIMSGTLAGRTREHGSFSLSCPGLGGDGSFWSGCIVLRTRCAWLFTCENVNHTRFSNIIASPRVRGPNGEHISRVLCTLRSASRLTLVTARFLLHSIYIFGFHCLRRSLVR